MPWVCGYIYTWEWVSAVLMAGMGQALSARLYLTFPSLALIVLSMWTVQLSCLTLGTIQLFKGAGLSLKGRSEHHPYISSYLGCRQQDLLFPFSLLIWEIGGHTEPIPSAWTHQDPLIERTNLATRPPNIVSVHHSKSKIWQVREVHSPIPNHPFMICLVI